MPTTRATPPRAATRRRRPQPIARERTGSRDRPPARRRTRGALRPSRRPAASVRACPGLLTVDAPVPLWRPASGAPGSVVAVTSRRGGISGAPFDTLNLGRSTADDPDAVTENRRRVLASLDVEHVATAGQVHGADVAVVREPDFIARSTRWSRTSPVSPSPSPRPTVCPFCSFPPAPSARRTPAGAERWPASRAPPYGHSDASPTRRPTRFMSTWARASAHAVIESVTTSPRAFPDAAVVRDDAGARVDLAARRTSRGSSPPACAPNGSPIRPAARRATSSDCFPPARRRAHGDRHWGVAALL